jgi:hypothetical protein
MEADILTAASTMGVGALFGIVVFCIYRIDRKASEDRWINHGKELESRLCSMVKADQESRQENTKVLSELVTLLERMNGKHR